MNDQEGGREGVQELQERFLFLADKDLGRGAKLTVSRLLVLAMQVCFLQHDGLIVSAK